MRFMTTLCLGLAMTGLVSATPSDVLLDEFSGGTPFALSAGFWEDGWASDGSVIGGQRDWNYLWLSGNGGTQAELSFSPSAGFEYDGTGAEPNSWYWSVQYGMAQGTNLDLTALLPCATHIRITVENLDATDHELQLGVLTHDEPGTMRESSRWHDLPAGVSQVDHSLTDWPFSHYLDLNGALDDLPNLQLKFYHHNGFGGTSDDVHYIVRSVSLVCLQTPSADTEDLPATFGLGANYPNPFNPASTIPFELAETAQVRLSVHDLAGRTVAVLHEGLTAAGSHRVVFDGAALPSGLYYYTLQAGDRLETRSMVLVK